jgi:hypothetical protein
MHHRFRSPYGVSAQLLTWQYSMFLLVALILLAAVAPARAAAAGGPATVTVRIQGLNETLLPQTEVTTNATPIAVEKLTCEGTTAGGALFDATGGRWVAKESSLGVELLGLEGLNFEEFSKNPGIFWGFWLNGKAASNGVCGQSIASGDHIVMFPQCYETGPMCASKTAPDHFLTIAAPEPASANVGQPVQVKLASISTASETGTPESTLPEGTLLSAGPLNVVPGAGGVAKIAFSAPGTYLVQAHAPDSVPSDTYSICVHNGNDGTCGTQPAGSSTSTSGGSTGNGVKGGPPIPELARIAGVKNSHVYPHREAPRILEGIVSVPPGDTLRQVRISLQRRQHGRCYDFSGKRARFVLNRKCRPVFFSVGSSESFSYLLPTRLPAGHYTYEIEAIDGAGHVTKLVSGVSHVVFTVK